VGRKNSQGGQRCCRVYVAAIVEVQRMMMACSSQGGEKCNGQSGELHDEYLNRRMSSVMVVRRCLPKALKHSMLDVPTVLYVEYDFRSEWLLYGLRMSIWTVV
jgi:hypothetical protein